MPSGLIFVFFLSPRQQYQLFHRSSFPETEIPAGQEHQLLCQAGNSKGPLTRSPVSFLFRQHNDSTVEIPIAYQHFSIFPTYSHLLLIHWTLLHDILKISHFFSFILIISGKFSIILKRSHSCQRILAALNRS